MYELSVPKKGGPGKTGKQGKPLQVHANYLPIKFKPNHKLVNHYDVNIKGPWTRTNKRSDAPLFRKAFKILCAKNAKTIPPFVAFDGVNNMFSTQQLAVGKDQKWSGEVELEENDFKDGKVKLVFNIKLVKSNIDLSGAVAGFIKGSLGDENVHGEAQIMNIILSQIARDKCETIGRNFFPDSSMPGRSVDLPGGKSIWFGLFQSVSVGWKPFLNVDMANKPAVQNNPMIQHMEKVLSRGRNKWDFRDQWNGDRFGRPLEMELKGLKIRYNRPDKQVREWRFHKVMEAANKLKFEYEEKKTGEKKLITVEEYFKKDMKYKLQYPHLPCLHLGSPNKNIYIPVELCEMKGQTLPMNKKLQDEETQAMIKATAIAPIERKRRIEDSLKQMSKCFQEDEYAKHFGISVESVMSQIQARVYPTPALAYHDRNSKVAFKFEVPAPGGKWDMKKVRSNIKPSFIDNRHLVNWVLIDLAGTDPRSIDNFIRNLNAEGQSIGYQIEFEQKRFFADGRNLNNVLETFRKACDFLRANLKESKSPPMILVITPGKNSFIYNGLKHEGDVQQKISTQIVQQKTVRDCKQSTIHNLLLKINSKLGGVNQALHSDNTPSILRTPVMIMGADVTHAAADQKDKKTSIAAVVASMDAKASQYKCEIRFQDSGQNEEMIHSMEEVTEKLIRGFLAQGWNKGRFKPQRIIFYRDGVSEGQFLTVLNIELVAIRAACAKIDPDWQPPITYIVAQKRHKTRLFPVNPKDGIGKNQNVPPGTVVDHTITHPTEFSFYLASHEGIQGTTKPTNYHLLWDDFNMTADDIIKMTYYLCHVYARCERSVSYPAPTYYAHLAAFRARVHDDALLQSKQATKENRRKLQEDIGLTNYFM